MSGRSKLSVEDLCTAIIDYRGKTPPKSNSGVRLLTAKVVKGGRIFDEPAEFIPTEIYDSWMNRGLPQQYDVLVTTEAPLGEVGIIRSTERVAVGQRLILLRANPDIADQRYFYYALQGPEAQADVRSRATGTTVSGIKQAELRRVRVPLWPLDIQRRIAGILSAYDDLIEVNTRRIAILEEMARRLFDEWFVKFRFPGHKEFAGTRATAPPPGWRYVRLGDLAQDIRDSVLPSEVSPGTPYVGLEHIPRRSTTLLAAGRAEQVASTKLRFKSGDILFGKIRPYFHKVVMAPFSGVTSSDSIVMRPSNEELAALVLCVVSSDAFIAHAVQTSNGTKMPRANWNVIRNYEVVMPPNDLLNRFTDIVGSANKICPLLAAANNNLRAARDLLLPKLISGEIDVSGAARQTKRAVKRAAAE